jgi:hypothetical protein
LSTIDRFGASIDIDASVVVGIFVLISSDAVRVSFEELAKPLKREPVSPVTTVVMMAGDAGFSCTISAKFGISKAAALRVVRVCCGAVGLERSVVVTVEADAIDVEEESPIVDAAAGVKGVGTTMSAEVSSLPEFAFLSASACAAVKMDCKQTQEEIVELISESMNGIPSSHHESWNGSARTSGFGVGTT